MSRPRPSARSPLSVRIPRAAREFVAVPLVVMAILLVLAVGSIIGDQANGPTLHALRTALGHVIGADAASATLEAIATGLVTVTSITFSVLLLAVQQTASNLSPVVFDQFMRRKTNQVFLGLFVGLALYAYVVMAAVQDRTPPIIGAFLATVLTVVALACLLFLVYSTIDQMRPRNVMRQLHDRAVRAHAREGRLVRSTRRTSESALPVRAVYRSTTYGYVESVDVHAIAGALERRTDAGDVRDQPEVELHVTVGSEVATGDPIASIRHADDVAARRISRVVDRAVALSPAPDLDFDASTGISDLGNIAWTSGSTSKQNPAIAAQALHALRDLAARWVAEDRAGPSRLPVVYPDRDLDTVLDALYSTLVVAHESHQHQQAARVLDAYLALLEQAHGAVVDRLREDLRAAEPLLQEMPVSPVLAAARRGVDAALDGSAVLRQAGSVDGSADDLPHDVVVERPATTLREAPHGSRAHREEAGEDRERQGHSACVSQDRHR